MEIIITEVIKLKKKSLLIPTLYVLILFVITVGVYLTKKEFDTKEDSEVFDNINYVSKTILSRSIPVINSINQEKIVKPYINDSVKIGRGYYDVNLSLEEKEKAIVLYGNTFMQNTGIDYVMNDTFDVVSVYEGTVVDIVDDELLGKTVKIRHNASLISVYQGLSNIEVKKGDIVVTGQKIATSGFSKLNENLGNHLHFEVYQNGKIINPSNIYDRKLGDI